MEENSWHIFCPHIPKRSQILRLRLTLSRCQPPGSMRQLSHHIHRPCLGCLRSLLECYRWQHVNSTVQKAKELHLSRYLWQCHIYLLWNPERRSHWNAVMCLSCWTADFHVPISSDLMNTYKTLFFPPATTILRPLFMNVIAWPIRVLPIGVSAWLCHVSVSKS